MKTFIVTASSPKKRHGFYLTKGVVVAESAEKACEVAKNHYPPTATGWAPNTEFSAIEVPHNTFWTQI